MGYAAIEDFAAGIDLRKSATTAKPGTLRKLTNALVNAGGEIEMRKKFTKLFDAPPGSVGLGSTGAAQLVVFKPTAAPDYPPAAIPGYPSVITLADDAATAYTGVQRVLDVDAFQGLTYVIARRTNGVVRHYYNGTPVPAGVGRTARAHKAKMYTVDGNIIRFSTINDPTHWSDTVSAVGSGLIDGTSQDAGYPEFIGLEAYYQSLALFGRRSIQLWSMDPDPDKNTLTQVISGQGLVAPFATARYGTGDVLFLSDTGVRSLRARDASNAAILNDIGSPIDNLIVPRRAALTPATAEMVRALIDPLTGHFWLIWRDKIFVLAYYPATKVTAWSVLEPNFPDPIEYATTCGNRIVLRAGDGIYVYGHADGVTDPFSDYTGLEDPSLEYDPAVPVTVEMPFLDFGKPATTKTFQGMDASLEGAWHVDVNPDPLAPDAWVTTAVLSSMSFTLNRIPLNQSTTHLALRLRSINGTPARLGSVALHFEGGEQS